MKYDLVCVLFVMHHILEPDRIKIFKNISAAIKPGGKFMIGELDIEFSD